MKVLMLVSIAVGLTLGLTSPAFAGVGGPPRAATTIVPNVVGKTLTEAMTAIRTAGLNPVTQLADRDGKLRVVERQQPAGGATAERGTNVQIFGKIPSLPPADDDTKGTVKIPRAVPQDGDQKGRVTIPR